jgi:predicted phosphodiesterase
MIHGHQVDPRYELLLERFPLATVIVHGHTHRPKREKFESRWIVNPGAASKNRGGEPPSLAIAKIEQGEVDVTHLALPGGEPFTPG